MKQHLKKAAALITACVIGLSTLAGCTQVNGERIAVTIDGNEYGRSEALLYFYYEQYDIEYNVYGLADSMYGGLMNFWAVDTDSYSSVEMCREDAMQSLIQTKILCDQAEKDGVALDEDDEALLTRTVNRFMRNFADIVSAAEASKDDVTAFIRENMLANKEYLYLTEEIDREINAEDFRRKKVEGLTLQIKTDDDGNYLDQDEQKEICEKYIDEIMILLNTDASVDDIADLYSENEEMGVNSVAETDISIPDDYDADADPDDYYDLGWGLSTGESDYLMQINASDNYVVYFCRCIDDDDAEAEEEAISEELAERRSELFTEKYADILAGYKKIHVNTEVIEDFNISETLYDGSEYESAYEENEDYDYDYILE